MAHRPPDSAHVEDGTVLRTFLERAKAEFTSAPLRQWWVLWNGSLHALFLVSGSLWCILHPQSFTRLLPAEMPVWSMRLLAVGLVLFALLLLLWVFRGRVPRGMRYAAISISAVLAIAAWWISLTAPVPSFYGLVGAAHAMFAIGWTLLLVAPRKKRRVRNPVN